MTSVLFLGNSATYCSAMPQMFRLICENRGRDVSVRQLTRGGYTLERYLDPADPGGAKLDELLAEESHFDLIFLQELTTLPATDPARYAESLGRMREKLMPLGARFVLYQTIARAEGHPDLIKLGLTRRAMAEATAAACAEMGRRYRCAVSPVGTAFERLAVTHPDLRLYYMDNAHPSAAGSYLIALCHYATAFGDDPTLVTYRLPQIDEESAKILRRAARDAVLGG